LSGEQEKAMPEMLAGLPPEERRTLKHPHSIIEDEADLIVCARRSDETTVSLDEVLAEVGIRRRRLSAWRAFGKPAHGRRRGASKLLCDEVKWLRVLVLNRQPAWDLAVGRVRVEPVLIVCSRLPRGD
jgi:hypothetical protein